MLGAEGVKRAVIGRLQVTMPVAVQVRRAITGTTAAEIPDVTRFYPSLIPHGMDLSRFPYVTVTIEGTNGELSNQRTNVGSIVEGFEFEYTVAIQLHVLVESQSGEQQARLQVERLALAVREALLGDTELDAPGRDEADVMFERWAEEYDATPPDNEGAWVASAFLAVPVATTEYLDRAPYIDARNAVLQSWDVDKLATGTAYPQS